jgi:fluoride exporter
LPEVFFFIFIDQKVPLNILIDPNIERFLLISLGAILGANTRYWLGDWAAQKWGSNFPFGTIIINLTGSFLLGLFMTLATERFMIDPRWRFLFAIGFLGAYTTFSTYAFESFNLLFKGQWLPGLLNLFGSTILGVIAVGIGVYLGKSI